MVFGSVITTALLVIECFILAMVMRVRDPYRADLQNLAFWFFVCGAFSGLALIGYLLARGPLPAINADVFFLMAYVVSSIAVLLLAVLSVRYFSEWLVWTGLTVLIIMAIGVAGLVIQLAEENREQWLVPFLLFAPVLLLHMAALINAFAVTRDRNAIFGMVGIVLVLLGATYKYSGVPLASYFDQTAVFHLFVLIALPLTYMGFLALVGEREFQPSSFRRR